MHQEVAACKPRQPPRALIIGVIAIVIPITAAAALLPAGGQPIRTTTATPHATERTRDCDSASYTAPRELLRKSSFKSGGGSLHYTFAFERLVGFFFVKTGKGPPKGV